jgi:tRNA1(Val) A37 N6-methylase TrmN6
VGRSVLSDDAPAHRMAGQELSEDAILGGRVRLRQPRRGYRAGLDAALLAAACDAAEGERVVDVGCGGGGALLAAAARRPGVRFTGLERDEAALELARGNTALNGLQGQVEVSAADVTRRFSSLGLAPFDQALANPPFFDDPAALRGPAPERQGAWLADGGLQAWTGFLLKAVREGGRITVIHRADRLADLLAPSIRSPTPRPSGCGCAPSRRGRPLSCSCRHWCCMNATGRSTRPLWRRSCGAKRTCPGSDGQPRDTSLRTSSSAASHTTGSLRKMMRLRNPSLR